MEQVGRKLRSAIRHARNGEFGHLRDRLARLIWSERCRIVLRRDLHAPPPAPRPLAPFALRPYRSGDEEVLFANLPPDQKADRDWLELLLRNRLAGAHVAVLQDGTPCFIQWLLTSAQNAEITQLSDGILPELAADAVMLEAAYTPPRFRRLSIMPAAMARLAEHGTALGARWAIVCIRLDNRSMQTAAGWAGFELQQLRIDRHRLFRRKTFNVDLPPEAASDVGRSPSMARQAGWEKSAPTQVRVG